MDTRGKELATRCYNEDEDFLAKEKIAEWLGGQYVLHYTIPRGMLIYFSGRINKLALRHYVDFFDFGGLRLDLAFRSVSRIAAVLIMPFTIYHQPLLCETLFERRNTTSRSNFRGI
jgi:hypothetical protein